MMTESQILEEVLRFVGIRDLGKERWFRNENGWYDRYDGITIDSEELCGRVIEAIAAMIEEQTDTDDTETCKEQKSKLVLISRRDALKPFCIAPDGTRIPEVDCDNFPVEFSVEFIKKHLLSLPSADAAEVVRCKDCKHRYGDECPMRHVEWVECEEDGFICGARMERL